MRFRHQPNQSNEERSFNSLIFDSHFECGNLEYAIYHEGTNEYNLIISNDPCPLYSQWYYFSIKKALKGKEIKLNILNSSKATQLYKCCMKPYVFSEKEYELEHQDWHYINDTPTYSKSQNDQNAFYKKSGLDKYFNDNKHYTLSFSYTAKYDDDVIYFALLKPYTFRRMYEFIYEIEQKLKLQALNRVENRNNHMVHYITKNVIYSRDFICFTKGGLPIDIIRISDVSTESKSIIFITGRVHPSETPGSYKVEELIRSLLTPNNFIKYYTFVIVPMVNPDGVVLGHTRTDYDGNDLNRCWETPEKDESFPIYKIKLYIKELYLNGEQISLFCDFHGHSKLPNSFMYCCYRCEDADLWSKARVFPKIMAKHSPYFALNCCQFKIEAEKVYVDIEIYK